MRDLKSILECRPIIADKDKLKYYKRVILEEIQSTNPRCTKMWVHVRIIKNLSSCKADDVEKLYWRTKSKAQNDRISFAFAFNLLTKV